MKYLGTFFLLFAFHLSLSQPNSVNVIIQRMLKSSEVLRSAKFSLYTEERMKNGKFVVTNRFVKILTKPKEIYFYSVKPNPGTEIIWKEGWNNNKMMISPGSFPFITFSMNPNSSMARKDSHHSIRHLGFDNVFAGQSIKIPNFYCRKIELYIARVNWLPLRQLISDQNGLYEKYEMKSFLLNPVFKTGEFSPEFEEYKF